ncbi:dnaJ homolog subfamily C member 16-like [Anopheles albimanus]|uniref:dnaJ homolog subfamily C member 16-like n=1 Tax=Anopheles albimanus TaxID=7167 RepID=UPI00163F5D42|nr:dnaJ homolog subfamily C member 16-like [Anopheles albimanus]XP_035780875.1 dnaJ homolog subfamily C member 16-like [Anopheles albimanus]XP_035780960.1 dnaJ homolog subfamily C member 16-like [Anopheles albimanus]
MHGWVPRRMVHWLCLAVFVTVLLVQCDSKDPYGTLGVERKATLQEIRRAYKQLAKEWHPDKSKHPEAEQRFVEIKQAYELLSDSERRKAYDQYGITNEDAIVNRERPDYTTYSRFQDPFEHFYGAHNFNFHDQDISLYHRLSITAKYYETNIVPKSRQTPQILMFYADWCFDCMKAANSFKKMIDTLEPYGVTFATINAGHEEQLVRRTGVHSLPCIVMVLDGHNYIYRESVFNAQHLVDFIRQKMPYKLLTPVTDDTLDAFLAGWTDNRARALILEPRVQPRLRYLITAFHFRERVAFGFVALNGRSTRHIQERFKNHPSLDTLLLFNEFPQRPVASISMSDIPTLTLNNVIGVNKFLVLPRLSSQPVLDGVCPVEWNRPRKRLCVVLVTENTSLHDGARQMLRRIALESSFSRERVRFAYIYREKQDEFIGALSQNNQLLQDALLKLVILWRRDTKHIRYEWLHEVVLQVDRASAENETHDQFFNSTKHKVDSAIQRLLRTSEALSYEAEVKDLLDEHAQCLAIRMLNRLLLAIEFMTDNVGQEHILPALSVIGTIAFIFIIGYLMSYLLRLEEEDIQQKQGKNMESMNGKASSYIPELRLHELRAEKYNGLVRLLKPGCRTIVLLTDMQSRPKLISAFHKAVWPYRKNKTLMFAHMLIEKGIGWYAELLRLSLSESREMKINPRNCIGTVIALNGHRKYFCMYHAKHPESNRGAKRMIKMTRHLTSMPSDPEAGAFLGMESSDSEASMSDVSEPKILLEENLLDGLPNWLDRLFEGTTHRYYINYWPDFTSK